MLHYGIPILSVLCALAGVYFAGCGQLLEAALFALFAFLFLAFPVLLDRSI